VHGVPRGMIVRLGFGRRICDSSDTGPRQLREERGRRSPRPADAAAQFGMPVALARLGSAAEDLGELDRLWIEVRCYARDAINGLNIKQSHLKKMSGWSCNALLGGDDDAGLPMQIAELRAQLGLN
jgi:hypothetical protein